MGCRVQEEPPEGAGAGKGVRGGIKKDSWEDQKRQHLEKQAAQCLMQRNPSLDEGVFPHLLA